MPARSAHIAARASIPISQWDFPEPNTSDPSGLVALGADLEVSTLLEAYCRGLFPMPVTRRKLGWFSPDPRGVLKLSDFVESRSHRRSLRRFTIRVDTAFAKVVELCGDPARPNGWIDDRIKAGYSNLHRAGFAHSVEAYDENDELVGGLYGVAIGALFAGESMFHHKTDASKVALSYLVRALSQAPQALLDIQWLTPHLLTLGASEIPRAEYLSLLEPATSAPQLSLIEPTSEE